MADVPEAPRDLEIIRFEGKIHLITSDAGLAEVADQLRSATMLGFDTETRPSFKKGEVYQVALLQLATEENAYLIRLHSVRQFHVFKEIFEDPQILKVGAAIRDDLKGLRKLFEFAPQNFIELQDVAKEKGLKNFGLKGMTEEVLNAKLSKRAKTTNWEARVLTEQQLVYAATDAWVGLQLFKKLSAVHS